MYRFPHEISALVVPTCESCADETRIACLLASNAHLLKIKNEKCTGCDKTEEKCKWHLPRVSMYCYLSYFEYAWREPISVLSENQGKTNKIKQPRFTVKHTRNLLADQHGEVFISGHTVIKCRTWGHTSSLGMVAKTSCPQYLLSALQWWHFGGPWAPSRKSVSSCTLAAEQGSTIKFQSRGCGQFPGCDSKGRGEVLPPPCLSLHVVAVCYVKGHLDQWQRAASGSAIIIGMWLALTACQALL